MDLSWERRCEDIRRRVAQDAVTAQELADATADASRALLLRGKAEYAVSLLGWINELHRDRGPNA